MEAALSALVLPPRLQVAAELVLPGRPMADVGTDHAALPAWLVQHGKVPRAIGIDVAVGPLGIAARTLARHGVHGVELRRGDGLSVLGAGEVDTVVIAGMGGAKVQRLIGTAAALAVRRLVLQPNTEWPAVRASTHRQGWALVEEVIVREARHDYLVLALERAHADAPALDEADLELGPRLRRHPTPAWRAWVERTRARLHRNAAAAAGDAERAARLLARARIFDDAAIGRAVDPPSRG